MRFNPISKLPSAQRMQIWVIAAIGLAALALVLNIRWTWASDDVNFLNFSNQFERQLIPFLQMRLATWTSRVAIETVSFTLVNHVFWWRIGTAISFWVCIILPPFFITRSVRQRLALFPASALLVLSIPNTVWFDAGFIVTSVVYLWVLSASLLAVTPAIYLIQRRRLNPLWYLVAIPAAVFAGSSELAAALMAGLFAYTVALQFRRWWVSRSSETLVAAIIPALFLVFMIGMVIFHLTSTGNAARGQSANWVGPGALATIEKAYSSTLRQLYTRSYVIPIAYFALVAYRNYQRRGWSIFTWLSIAPIAGALLLQDPYKEGTMSTMISNTFTAGNLLWDPTGPALIPTFYPANLFVLALLSFLLIATAAATIGATGWNANGIVALVILAAGLFTKFIVVNTVGLALDLQFHRTDLYLLFAFGLATLLTVADGLIPTGSPNRPAPAPAAANATEFGTVSEDGAASGARR